MSLPKACAKALAPGVVVFGDGGSMEVIKVKTSPEDGALTYRISVALPLIVRIVRTAHRGRAMGGRREKTPSISQEESPRQKQPCQTLIWGFQAAEL